MLSSLFVLAAEDVSQRGAVNWIPSILISFLLLGGLIAFAYMTKAGIIARATTKEAVRQPVFLLCMALAIVILALNYVLPFFSLGEDVKMLKDCRLALPAPLVGRRGGVSVPQHQPAANESDGDHLAARHRGLSLCGSSLLPQATSIK